MHYGSSRHSPTSTLSRAGHYAHGNSYKEPRDALAVEVAEGEGGLWAALFRQKRWLDATLAWQARDLA